MKKAFQVKKKLLLLTVGLCIAGTILISGFTEPPSSTESATTNQKEGGAFRIVNANTNNRGIGNKAWIGFSFRNPTSSDEWNYSDQNDRARIGVQSTENGSGELFFTTGLYNNQQTERIRILANGIVRIGSNMFKPINSSYTDKYLLWVSKGVVSEDFAVVAENNWSDYVFDSAYKVPELSAVEQFIHKKHHLPEMPSAREVKKNGYSLREMNRLLLKKVEELTLYVISQQKETHRLKEEIDELKKH